MKKFFFLLIAFTLVGCARTSTHAPKGTTSSGGGDPYEGEFRDVARSIVRRLKAREMTELQGVSVLAFETKAEKLTLTSTDSVLKKDGKVVDALNYPDEGRIELSLIRWPMMGAFTKKRLVVHEIMGLLRIEDLKYRRSSDFLAALGLQPEVQNVVKPTKTLQFIVDAKSWIHLSHYVANPDDLTLLYKVRSGPAFASLTEDDRIRLDPATGDEGHHVIVVEVSDGWKLDVLEIQILIRPGDFKWREGEKWMRAAVVGRHFFFRTDNFTDGEFLHIRWIDGPRWLALRMEQEPIGTSGHFLVGTPATDHGGPFSVTLELESQNGTKTQERIFGNVVYAFPYDSKARGPAARIGVPYYLDLAHIAASPTCPSFEWAIPSPPSWLQVRGKPPGTTTGFNTLPTLGGTPQVGDAGTHKFTVILNCAEEGSRRAKTEIEIGVSQ